MAGRPQPQTAVAGALCLVLSLLYGRAAAQGTPVTGPTQGSAELSMHLVERMKAKQKEPTLNDYYLSARRDFGVQHCLLQGILPFNNESTLLPPPPEDPEDPQGCKHLADLSRPGHKIAYHLLVRMVVSNGTAYVRGITSLEPIGRHFVSFHYLSQSYFFQQFKQELWLGSQRTGKKYGPLLISKVRWFQWEKWHLWGETVSRIHFQPIPLLPEDAEAPEFELYSEYFPYTCFIVPAHDQPMGTLMSKATRPVKLQPHLVPPHAYPRVIFLTSGFFLLSPIWGTKMLTWHMAWHKQYGVDLYVMYMQMEVLHLLEQPVIQELIQDGELSVISWDVMPGLATPMFSKETEHSCVDNVGYWNQIFLYNHFLIAMWLEDVIVIVADVDEWLMTPKPKTIHTMLMDCAPEAVNQPLAFLSIVRRIGWCKGCGVTENGTTAEVEYWMNFNVSTTPPEQHPIRKYVLGTWDDPIKPKSIYIPALTLSVDPHVGQVVEGSASRSHPTECAYFMHMTTLFINRHYGWDHRNEGTPDEIFLGQFWPSHHNHTGPNILTTKY